MVALVFLCRSVNSTRCSATSPLGVGGSVTSSSSLGRVMKVVLLLEPAWNGVVENRSSMSML